METLLNLEIENRRLSFAEGLKIFQQADLLSLGQAAQRLRFQKNPQKSVSYVIDSNPNYTNVCVTDCSFCAFYRKPGAPGAWTLSVDEVLQKVAAAAALGATTVLLQGGHNPDLPLDYYLEIVRRTRTEFPQITPHFFTASEITHLAEWSGISIEQVLQKLYDAGQRTLPGGGAEVLSERVRKKLAFKKGGPEAWLNVHRTAHKIGFRSTATMMYGHIETPQDIVEHLESIRALQDETGGFTAFVPWSFKPNNTPLDKAAKGSAQRPTANDYLRIIAFSRLYLDNFDHIQASWFSEGKKTGQVALHFGADDFGGTLFEENVHAATEHINTTTVAGIQDLIREAGFEPTQRTTLYEPLPHSEKE